MPELRDRLIELRRVKAGEIDGAPWNWREHPKEQQAAVKASLDELGIIDALKVREMPDGRYQLWDGHLRNEQFMGIGPDTIVPVLVTDLDEAEAKKANLLFDPLSALAEANAEKLDALLREVETGSEDLAKMLAGLAEENGIAPGEEKATELREMDVKPPPKVTWVLVGIPTVRFGEVAETIEELAKIEGVFLETTSNDG